MHGLLEDTARHRSRRSERQLLCWTDVEEALAFFSSLHFSHFIIHRKKILFILIIYTSISQACIMIWDIKSHGSTRGKMNSLSCAVIWLLVVVIVIIICLILFTAGLPSSLQSSAFSLSLHFFLLSPQPSYTHTHTHTYIHRLKWNPSGCLDVRVKTCYWLLLLLLLVLITFFLTLLSVSS